MDGLNKYNITDDEFGFIRKIVYDRVGINLTEAKRQLVITRLSRRLRNFGMTSFSEYIDYLQNNDPSGQEFENMINRISTNTTHFFREPYHFDLLKNTILPSMHGKTVKIWSAASSFGHEIYSVLMTAFQYREETKANIKFQFFASDISSNALTGAKEGIYRIDDIQKISKPLLKKYFLKGTGSMEGYAMLRRHFSEMVNFKQINLLEDNYNLPEMDVIFLRNVIIYFDKPTKEKIINRTSSILRENGYFFLGHSESILGMNVPLKLIGRTAYQKTSG